MNRAERPKPRFDSGTVCLGVPHRGVEDEFFDSFAGLVFAERERITEYAIVGGSLVAPARNEIVRRFLGGRCEWLVFLDADMAFPPDVLRALLAHADAVERPIVGALCFKVARDGTTEPTLYRLALEPHTHLRAVRDWTPDALVAVDATGGACLLVHRSVLEAMADPWFSAGELAGQEIGEDVTFCLSARQAGFPIYVASTIDIGHIKPRSFGLADWQRQQAELAAVYTLAVVPVRDASDPLPDTDGCIGAFAIANDELDPAVRGGCPTNTPAKFNIGLDDAEQWARARGLRRWNVLFLNDDVELEPGCVDKLARALRADPVYALAYPNVHGMSGDGVVTTHTEDVGGLTHSGWAFMVRGESATRFDERFVWWFPDNAYEKEIHAAGFKVACVLDAHATHLHGNESTLADPRLLAQAERDEALFAEVYGVDRAALPLSKLLAAQSSRSA